MCVGSTGIYAGGRMRRTLRSGSTRAQDMAEVAGAAAVWRTLKIPDYRNYMAGNFVSQDGLWTPRVGVQWLTCELTESPTWLGVMAFAEFFPIVVMAPLGGRVASLYILFARGCPAFGALLMGTLAEYAGLRMAEALESGPMAT